MISLFFELIRVALGTQTSLSRLPKADEWDELFAMARKQSLVGIAFVGLQKLGANMDDGYARIGISEVLFLSWFGVAAKIQLQNDVVNQQCAEVQRRLSADGFRCCILKGQGVAQQYNEPLRSFRQSGDIDVWMDGGHKEVLDYLRSNYEVGRILYHHADVNMFDTAKGSEADTEVEVHFVPTWLYTPWKERALRRFFDEVKDGEFDNVNSLGFSQNTARFNRIFLLLHAYRHYTAEGLGLRHVMDYYFTLKQGFTMEERHSTMALLKKLGVHKFAAGMMYVIKAAFGMPNEFLLCEPDPRTGARLLNEIMEGGNFGHDAEGRKRASGLVGSFRNRYGRQLATMKDNPSELFFAPLWKVWHQLWLRKIR